MKIDSNVNNINPLDRVSKKDRVSVRATEGKSAEKHVDKAVVSESAQLMAKAMDALRGSDGIRESQLEEIRALIMNGQYQIKYEELAKRLASKIWLR